MGLETLCQLLGVQSIIANVVDRLEEGILVDLAVRLQELDHVLRGLCALELLAVQELGLEHMEGLASPDKGLGAFAVTAAVAFN